MDPPINEEGYTGECEEVSSHVTRNAKGATLSREEVSSLQEGYNGVDGGEVSPSLERNASVTHNRESTCVHSLQCCSHDSMVNRIQALQMSMQSLDFSIRELKDGQSKMLWKLIAVIGVTSFLCGYLGIHNWLNVLFG